MFVLFLGLKCYNHSLHFLWSLYLFLYCLSFYFGLGLFVIISGSVVRFGGVWKSGGLKVYWMKDCQHLNEWERRKKMWHLRLIGPGFFYCSFFVLQKNVYVCVAFFRVLKSEPFFRANCHWASLIVILCLMTVEREKLCFFLLRCILPSLFSTFTIYILEKKN